jgi:cytosine/creatinine deaminase
VTSVNPGGSLLLAGVTLADGSEADVRLSDATIDAVGPPGTLAPAEERLELPGYLLVPAPAEPHAHFDSALTVDRVHNPAGDLGGAIDAWLAYQPTVPYEDFVARARNAALQGLSQGATAIRTHIGVYPAGGLRPVEALLEVREMLREWVDIQLVALTIRLTGAEGAESLRLLRAAMEMGVDLVGGCPHLDPDPSACNEICLQVAEEFGRPVDVHTDETLEPRTLYLEDLAKRVMARSFPHPVTASHCVSLGVQPPDVAARVSAAVAAAGVAVVCNPQTNLYLQARGSTHLAPRGLTAVRALLGAGATLAAGGDNLRDPFNPLGRVDPLETASLLVTAGHLTPAEAYAAVSSGARKAMGLPEIRVSAGYPAELLAVAGSTIDGVLAYPTSRVVVHRGRIVSRTTVTRELPQVPTSRKERP